ncbi:alpha/beta fold hydrolase [Arenicella xantha]|uniref:alpha/beta fold hydrolase n=1 Tax=Arenicella xantha TaxID=644221 RepID=UPI001474795D|nr:alpha/beta hydrolase [Arenicella xantha]
MKKTIISLLLVMLFSLVSFNMTASKGNATPAKLGTQVILAKAEVNDFEIAYRVAGDVNKPGVLFIHGTPGDGTAFSSYLENSSLQSEFLLISVDRLGWGTSTLPDKLVDGDFALQAQSIIAVMEKFPNQQWIVVGHSLGASIAPKVALLAPQKVRRLILLAGSLDPKLGKPRWYNRAANTWLISRLIGRSMRHSNREIMNLSQQLNIMNQQLVENRLNVDVVVIQGMKDRLVSPDNATFAKQSWQNHFRQLDIIELESEGHFLPWRQAELVIKTIQSTQHETAITQ